MQVGEWLERLPTLPKTTLRDQPRTNSRTLTDCPSSSEWGPGRNTEDIQAVRKGTGHPTSESQWPRTSVLSNRHFPNIRIVYGTYICFYLVYPSILINIPFPSAGVIMHFQQRIVFHTVEMAKFQNQPSIEW